MMKKAVWNNVTLAESDLCIQVEGNYYFPPESINRSYFQTSSTKTICSWKGEANYYDIVVGTQINKDAAWYYPAPKAAAQNITGYLAFWKGVQII
ncbi:MAG: DUF427 domain-containing protein [Candidatus Caenarcaniphilales bacterium]|nr:DUF427 domain-containing protein [Candidatus Caenarcaniphilales bacterium]